MQFSKSKLSIPGAEISDYVMSSRRPLDLYNFGPCEVCGEPSNHIVNDTVSLLPFDSKGFIDNVDLRRSHRFCERHRRDSIHLIGRETQAHYYARIAVAESRI